MIQIRCFNGFKLVKLLSLTEQRPATRGNSVDTAKIIKRLQSTPTGCNVTLPAVRGGLKFRRIFSTLHSKSGLNVDGAFEPLFLYFATDFVRLANVPVK